MKTWICKACAQDDICIFKADGDGVPTKCPDGGGDDCQWKESTKYQITEAPEPVNYLEIPVQMIVAVVDRLSSRNGADIIIVSESDGYTTIETTRFPGETNFVSRCWVIPSTWIKQKQPEPTREELQERLNYLDKELDGFKYQSSFIKKLRCAIKDGQK